MYKILAPSYIARGFGGYSIFRGKEVTYRQGTDLNRDAAITYIRARTPITTRLDGRISFLKASTGSPPCNNDATAMKPMLTLLLSAVPLVYSLIYN